MKTTETSHDVFASVKKNRLKEYIAMASGALLIAVSINGLLFGTTTGSQLQAAVISAVKPTDIKPDIYVVEGGTGSDMAAIVTGRAIENVSELRFIVSTNPEKVQILNTFSEDTSADLTSTTTDGLTMVFIRFSAPRTLQWGYRAAVIAYKSSTSEQVPLNLSDTLFVSSGTTYELTSQGGWITK